MNRLWTEVKLPKASNSDKLSPDLDIVRLLLTRRGITTAEAADKFLHPDYETGRSDPYLMKDMTKAVDRIIQAIQAGEKIIIFGDYDADGVPACALLTEFFRLIDYDNFDVYIPHRHNEPYGLSEPAVRKFADGGAGLIITVDCGITAVKEAALAKNLGLEVIITDHHLIQRVLPEALAILNPKQPDCPYPDKMLSGAGVAFKLVCALMRRDEIDLPIGQEKWLLDLVAIATISDMVPLIGENRILAYFGLKVLNKTRRLGLFYLFDSLKLKPGQITEDDIGFLIGPRINSAGRMSHASQAYFLLTTDREHEAETIVRHLEEQNKNRRRAVSEIIDYAGRELAGDLPPVVVIGKADWPIGVLGLAATRLAEVYNRVFFVWGENGHGQIKGSCRSDGRVNVVDLMAEAAGNCPFIDFGGHAGAGGFSLAKTNLKPLPATVNQAYKKIAQTNLAPKITIDAALALDDITVEFYKKIARLAPFGIGNPKPVFLFKNIIIESSQSFGADRNHLELVFKNSIGEKIKAIAFFACLKTDRTGKRTTKHVFGDFSLASGATVDLLANIEQSNFYFRPELRLRIVDLAEIS